MTTISKRMEQTKSMYLIMINHDATTLQCYLINLRPVETITVKTRGHINGHIK